MDLVRRAQRGDHDALDELLDRHGSELYRLAVAVIGPAAAADVTQDALVRAWRELPTLRDPERFLPWVRRILVNRARDVARSDARRVRAIPLDGLGDAPDRTAVRPDPAGSIDGAADLHAALARLTVDQRALLALHYVLGLSIREVADSLDVPVGTAKSRLNTALEVLRRDLGDGAT